MYRHLTSQAPTPPPDLGKIETLAPEPRRGSSTPLSTVEVFYSYAHKDEQLLGELINHLTILKRQRVIRDWHDRKITAGTEWKGQIDHHLNSARVILLLVSSDFIASDYCYDIELRTALERHERGEARVIPVILRPVDNWQAAPFGKLQAAPTNGRPVTQWPNPDEAFANVAGHIRNAVEEILNPLGGPLSSRGTTISVKRREVKEGEDIFVNREEERNLFEKMIRYETPIHILLIEAESSTGKTKLLDQFWKRSEGFRRAKVDFKNPSYTVGTILWELCEQYGQESFKLLRAECSEVLHVHRHDAQHPKQIWTKIDGVLRNSKLPEEERRQYEREITNAFLADLESIHEATDRRPLVVLFDTFDKASDLAKKWMTEVLIEEVRRNPWLICVVAGKQTPRTPLAEENCNRCLKQTTLQNLNDDQSRVFVRQYMRQEVTDKQDEGIIKVIDFIVYRSKGNPLELKTNAALFLEMQEKGDQK